MLDGFLGKLTSLAIRLMAPVLIYPLLALKHLVSDMHVHCMIHMYMLYMYIYIIHILPSTQRCMVVTYDM